MGLYVLSKAVFDKAVFENLPFLKIECSRKGTFGLLETYLTAGFCPRVSKQLY
jgi:hypothetical protein